jgi:hypothetical protein
MRYVIFEQHDHWWEYKSHSDLAHILEAVSGIERGYISSPYWDGVLFFGPYQAIDTPKMPEDMQEISRRINLQRSMK